MACEVTREDFDWAAALRRELHRHPETDFDLEWTCARVCRALDELGIPHTEKFGRCSTAAYLNPGGAGPALALRADMDALPVTEKTGLPFSSEIPGKMHACGHDAHTALLLGTARALKRRETALPGPVTLLFQPSEEGVQSGARMMAEAGALDGACAVVCTHSDNEIPAGEIRLCPGDFMAGCEPIDAVFRGRSVHAALAAEKGGGADAIAMGVRAWSALREAAAQEAAGSRCVYSVGVFSGGTAHNVIADRCELKITFRWFDAGLARRIEARTEAVCAEAAAAYGGTAEVEYHVSAPPVHNDERLTAACAAALRRAGIEPGSMPSRMSSEDFSWFLARVPGFIFRFGTRNEAEGCTSLAHTSDFRIDERGMLSAMRAFAALASDPDFIRAARGG